MRRRKLLIGGAIGAGVVLVGVLAAFIFYGRIAAWAVRSRVLPKVEARLGRTVEIGGIDVDRERVVLTDLKVRGDRDAADAPLATIARLEVRYEFWDAVFGEVSLGTMVVDQLDVRLHRDAEGNDNVSDLRRLLGGGADEAGGSGGRRTGLGLRPASLAVRSGSFLLVDERAGVELRARRFTVVVPPGGVDGEEPRSEAIVALGDLVGISGFGPEAHLQRVELQIDPDRPRESLRVELVGGALSMWTGMSLTGIAGTVAPGKDDGRVAIDLAGGYGGVEGQLWTAVGWVAPGERSGNLDIKADRFTFDRLRPILEGSMVQDFDDTSIDVELNIAMNRGDAQFNGAMNLSGLTVYHPMLADVPVKDLTFSSTVDGSFDSRSRTLTVSEMSIDYRDIPMRLDGFARLPGGVDPDTGERRAAFRVAGHWVVPSVPCQTALKALPRELTPHLQGFDLRGNFESELRVDIDWADLEATDLGGGVGIWRCKVKGAPKRMDAEALLDSFEHEVEIAPETWTTYTIGMDNPDFVPLWDVSEHLINSLMTTEDGRFFRHKGFISSEFRTALVRDLQEGYFKYGASSITMQTVKNIWLGREKLLARKLQELFLTWYIETVLEKERILEIYLNAIEYGPGLYGIGQATYYYFGKHPRDLNPREAAYFSMMLPGPKPRHSQYCNNQLDRKWERKIDRILARMHERERLTDEQFALVQITPLAFDYSEDFSPEECHAKYKVWTDYWEEQAELEAAQEAAAAEID